MNNHKEIKLSSNWTNIGLYGGCTTVLLILPLLVFTIKEQGFHMGLLVAAVVLISLIGFLIYQFLYVCDAWIKEDKIVLKKKFKPAKSYAFDKIGTLESFQLKRTKYITFDMKNDDGTMEKYLIVNSKSILAFENKDAEQVLNSLRNILKDKK